MESVNGKSFSNPHDLLGVDIEVDGSYFEFDQYADVLYQALDVLRDRQQEFGWNSYTAIDADACHPEETHESSNVIDAEYYVRVKKGLTGNVYAFDGTLHRISMLLGRERSGYSKTVRESAVTNSRRSSSTTTSRNPTLSKEQFSRTRKWACPSSTASTMTRCTGTISTG
ncbi:hypothetical protein G3I44_00010 [Halogeometricum borinquense]|uniref:DUF7845 domain-containing protein n=1 Tax=Halogeometricum borinquense TaxID=60847 RepID=A0A6C0UE66_9EURY|nr:hypothetical protein [Halogeometricum borinquense]QIB72813.1 hypothetical protein G3I44_00010 [Halogeometricum borinquense]